MTQQMTIIDTLRGLEKPFSAQNAYYLKFESECLFAKQQITKNDYALNAAQNNPEALRNAILNVAAVGISLNPASAHAYLVPRSPAQGQPAQICLDVAYRGLVKLATDSGAIEWAKAVLVYEGDDFKWRGPAEPPHHEADVFDVNRMDANDPMKNLKGGYCIAKLSDGGVMVDVMTAAEILAVKASSKAQNGPWKGKWAGEMAKKTLIKRASKSWPQSNGRNRLDHAIEIINAHEGLQEDAPIDEQAIEAFKDHVARGDGMALLAFAEKWGEKNKTAAFNSAPKGEKMKLKDDVRELETQAIAQIDTYEDLVKTAIDEGDIESIEELLGELTDTERGLLDKRLTDINHRQIQNLRDEAA